jgi:hypothetical protein
MLSAVAVVNLLAWGISAWVLRRRRRRFSARGYARRCVLLWLSAGYVAGCAFRAWLPRIDLERVCLLDSALSSMVIGRSVATVAELCFMAQCALVLHHAARVTDSRLALTVALALVPFIVVAEGWSWYAILSTNYLGHVLENSTWTLCALLLLASCAQLWRNSAQRERRFVLAMMVFASAYVVFMTSVDVPMYWSRWQADVAAGAGYLGLADGLRDAARPCIVSFDWRIWREEIPWMTLYFTVAVWVSIALPHAPSWGRGRGGPLARDADSGRRE